MSFEGNVAVVALIVSLIALLIALTQASVQLFSTAVGYSKCAESIIGPWSSKRHRRWLWSEFRFETQFVTPHIVLFTPLELLAAGDNACLLSLQRGDRKDFPEVELSLHPNSDITRVRRTDSSGRKLSNLQSQADLETRMILTHGRTANRQQVWSGSMVTWLTLLREAHSVYVKYWPDEHCFEHEFSDKIFHRNRPSRPSRITSGSMALKSSIRKARPAVGHQNEQRSDVGVIYRTWSWDLMPDMVRPLATSTVGDIVVLALRLGMEWTELDLGQGKMQASGNGCSLTSTEVRGLGILASFSAAGGQGASPYLVPSRAVDKLMCGVLPGSPQLVHRDYNLIGRDRELLKDEILGALEISDDIRSSIMKRDRRLTHNDILTLLCTFLPQKDSSAANHYCWYWREASPFSVFHWWEGRYALLRSLRKRVSHLAESESKVLRDALVRFEALSSGEYEEDFFSRWQDANLSSSGDEPVKSRAYLIGVRDIFDWTTEYFESMRFGSWEINGMTPYTRLVAAHLSMIHEAIEVVNEMLRKQKDARADVSQEALKRKYDLDGVHSYFFGQNMYEYGIAYAEHVDHPDFGVVKYFRDRDNSLPEAAIVDAWWVLMLRGVAWDMGTVGRAGPGQAVPSYLFNNQTPVWIT